MLQLQQFVQTQLVQPHVYSNQPWCPLSGSSCQHRDPTLFPYLFRARAFLRAASTLDQSQNSPNVDSIQSEKNETRKTESCSLVAAAAAREEEEEEVGGALGGRGAEAGHRRGGPRRQRKHRSEGLAVVIISRRTKWFLSFRFPLGGLAAAARGERGGHRLLGTTVCAVNR